MSSPFLPLLTNEESAQWETLYLRNQAGAISHAVRLIGRSLAEALKKDCDEFVPRASNTLQEGWALILVGRGHNGADALQTAICLLELFPLLKLDVVFASPEVSLKPLTQQLKNQLASMAEHRVRYNIWPSFQNTKQEPFFMSKRYIFCLDGLLGGGFKTPLQGPVAEIIPWVNRHCGIGLRVAIDLPSGLDAKPLPAAPIFRADLTYATGIPKRLLWSPNLQPFTGRVRLLDIGFFTLSALHKVLAGTKKTAPSIAEGSAFADPTQEAIEAAMEPPLDWRFATERIQEVLHQSHIRIKKPSAPSVELEWALSEAILDPVRALRDPFQDKRAYGHLLLIGLDPCLAGALFLAAQAALYSGVGRLSALVPGQLCPAFAANLPEVMWIPLPETSISRAGRAELTAAWSPHLSPLLHDVDVVLLGPGLPAHSSVLQFVELLSTIAPEKRWVLDAGALQTGTLQVLQSHPGPAVITPHPGEWARLAPTMPSEPEALHRAFQDIFPAPALRTLVFKSIPIRIFSKEMHCVNTVGGAALARGGSGDVLAGLIGGLWAQQKSLDGFIEACQAVYWQGKTADYLAQSSHPRTIFARHLLTSLGKVL